MTVRGHCGRPQPDFWSINNVALCHSAYGSPLLRLFVHLLFCPDVCLSHNFLYMPVCSPPPVGDVVPLNICVTFILYWTVYWLQRSEVEIIAKVKNYLEIKILSIEKNYKIVVLKSKNSRILRKDMQRNALDTARSIHIVIHLCYVIPSTHCFIWTLFYWINKTK